MPYSRETRLRLWRENPEYRAKQLATAKASRERNIEAKRARDRAAYAANREARREAQKARYAAKSREYKRAQHLRYSTRLNARFKSLLYSAQQRGIGVSITMEEYTAVVAEWKCHYCHGELPPVSGHGIDRKDGDRGYEVGNLVPCCTLCNRAKRNFFTYEEMVAIMETRRARGWRGWGDGV